MSKKKELEDNKESIFSKMEEELSKAQEECR
jgi:hypothetical protein